MLEGKVYRNCDACGGVVRGRDEAALDPTHGQLLVGTLRINVTVTKRLVNAPQMKNIKEVTEHRRYCPACSARVESLLKALDFKLEPEPA